MEILGKTLTRIAREKAGIIKPETPHLIGYLPPAAEKVMRSYCAKRHAPLHTMHRRRSHFHLEQFRLDYTSDNLKVRGIRPALIGEHQLKNTALALEAVSLLKKSKLRISDRAVRQGIEGTHWPGRFQIIRKPGKATMVLDVCHNAAGVAAFVKTCKLKFPGRKMAIVIGVVRKKEHQEMFDALSEIAREYCLTPLKTHRSVSPKELQQTVNWKGVPVRRFGGLRSACDTVVKNAATDDIILVVGSHYLVGEYLQTYGWS